MKLEVGDIILVKGKSEISEEICEVEKSPYSHCAGVVSDTMLIEAGWWKVKLDKISKYQGQADIYRCLNLDNFSKAMIANYASKQLYKKYDYALLLWEFVRYKLNIILPYFNTDSVICSELWGDAYKSVGITLCPSIRFPSPADLSLSPKLTKIGSI